MQKQRRWIRFVQENKDAEKLSRKASADGRYLRREQNMKLIDADALVTVGQMIMIVGFFGFMFGFLVMVCGWIIGEIL